MDPPFSFPDAFISLIEALVTHSIVAAPQAPRMNQNHPLLFPTARQARITSLISKPSPEPPIPLDDVFTTFWRRSVNGVPKKQFEEPQAVHGVSRPVTTTTTSPSSSRNDTVGQTETSRSDLDVSSAAQTESSRLPTSLEMLNRRRQERRERRRDIIQKQQKEMRKRSMGLWACVYANWGGPRRKFRDGDEDDWEGKEERQDGKEDEERMGEEDEGEEWERDEDLSEEKEAYERETEGETEGENEERYGEVDEGAMFGMNV